jgi:VanZ family protein
MVNSTTTSVSLQTKIIKYWLPVIAMLCIMYYFSTDVFSGENTKGIIGIILGWFTQVNWQTVSQINRVVRKSAHFIEYAILAFLLFRAFRAESPIRWRTRWAIYTLAVIVVWALLDEFHQSFTLSRGASIYDSMLDSSGGLFALGVTRIVYRRSTGLQPYCR